MPNLDDDDIAWLTARHHADADLLLLTIIHPMFGVYRLVRNNVDIVSRGQTFIKCWLSLDILNDDVDNPRSQLSMPALGMEIAKVLRTLVGAPECTIEVVSSADLDKPIYRAARLKLRNINRDAVFITGDLQRGDDNTEICGTIKITPARAPAIFRII